jgi:hypothetical protein
MRRLGVVCLLVLLIPVQASAAFRFHADANDSANRLDISGYQLRNPHHWVIKVSTYERVNLKRYGGSFFARFDTRGASRWDYELFIYYDKGSPGYYCVVNRRGGGFDRDHAKTFTWQVRARSVSCTFGKIKRNKALRTKVWTQNANGVVVDRAPNDGTFQKHSPDRPPNGTG